MAFFAQDSKLQEPRVLQLLLLPEGEPPPRPDGSPGIRKQEETN